VTRPMTRATTPQAKTDAEAIAYEKAALFQRQELHTLPSSAFTIRSLQKTLRSASNWPDRFRRNWCGHCGSCRIERDATCYAFAGCCATHWGDSFNRTRRLQAIRRDSAKLSGRIYECAMTWGKWKDTLDN